MLQNGEIKGNGGLNTNGAQHNMRDIAGEKIEPLNREPEEHTCYNLNQCQRVHVTGKKLNEISTWLESAVNSSE